MENEDQVTKIQKTCFVLHNGIDFSLNNATPLRQLADRSEWVEDTEASCCMICLRQFSLFIHRHHCRRCGRIFCYMCCPKQSFVDTDNQKRNCIVCIEVLKIAYTYQQQPDHIPDINFYLQKTEIQQALTRPDPVLTGEVIRIFTNCIRGDQAREALLQNSDVLQVVYNLLKQTVNYFTAQNKLQFFTKGKAPLSEQTASPILNICLSFVINFTASMNIKYAQLLHEKQFTTVIILLLDDNIDQLKIEYAIFALRNLAIYQQAADQIQKSTNFLKNIFQLLQCNIKNTIELTLGLAYNIARCVPESRQLLLPIKAISQTVQKCQLLLLKVNTFKQPLSRSFHCGIVGQLCQDQICLELILQNGFLNDIVKIIKDSIKQEDTTLSIINYQVSSMFRCLSIAFEECQEQQKQYIFKITKQLIKYNVVQFICINITNYQSSVSIFGSQLLLRLFQQTYEDVYQYITQVEDVERQFVQNCAQVIYKKAPFNDIIINIKQIRKIMKENNDKILNQKIQHLKNLD